MPRLPLPQTRLRAPQLPRLAPPPAHEPLPLPWLLRSVRRAQAALAHCEALLGGLEARPSLQLRAFSPALRLRATRLRADVDTAQREWAAMASRELASLAQAVEDINSRQQLLCELVALGYVVGDALAHLAGEQAAARQAAWTRILQDAAHNPHHQWEMVGARQ